MQLKKRVCLSFAFSCVITFSQMTLAGGAPDVPPVADGATGIGLSLAYNSMAANNFSFGIDYKLAQIEMGATLSMQVNEAVVPGTTNWSEYDVGGYLGYRLPVVSHLFASLGAQGNYAIISDEPSYANGAGVDHSPYVIGAYVGLSYEPTDHIAIFARVNPVSYQSFGYNDNTTRSGATANKWGFFASGIVGLSYYIV